MCRTVGDAGPAKEGPDNELLYTEIAPRLREWQQNRLVASAASELPPAGRQALQAQLLAASRRLRAHAHILVLGIPEDLPGGLLLLDQECRLELFNLEPLLHTAEPLLFRGTYS